MKERFECVDAGSEYCPCYLAETNDCMICSLLQGKDFCDCNWSGVCIYQEYAWNGYKSKTTRDIYKSKIIERTKIDSHCTILKLKVSQTLARQLKEPGAYVFLRDAKLPQYFDVPMSIMDVNEVEKSIYIAYQEHGAKTKKLNEINDELLIRGPYWNGVFGLKNLKKVKNTKCLVIARGIAQAPSVLVIKKLLKNHNDVTLILDKGKLETNFIEKSLESSNLKIIETSIMTEEGKKIVKNILKNQDISLIYSGGSDISHSVMLTIVDEVGVNPYLVITNNNDMCCGEGICGSCSIRLESGKIVKACKAQLDPRKVIERRT